MDQARWPGVIAMTDNATECDNGNNTYTSIVTIESFGNIGTVLLRGLKDDVLSPTGLFYCLVQNSNGVIQSLC